MTASASRSSVGRLPIAAPVPIRLIEPGGGHRRLELGREAGDGGDTVRALGGGRGLVEHEFSGREAWVHELDDTVKR